MLTSFFPQSAVTQSSVLVNTQAVNLTWKAPLEGLQNVAFWYDTDWKKYWQHAFVTANVAWSLHVADLVPLMSLGYLWHSYISCGQNVSIFLLFDAEDGCTISQQLLVSAIHMQQWAGTESHRCTQCTQVPTTHMTMYRHMYMHSM